MVKMITDDDFKRLPRAKNRTLFDLVMEFARIATMKSSGEKKGDEVPKTPIPKKTDAQDKSLLKQPKTKTSVSEENESGDVSKTGLRRFVSGENKLCSEPETSPKKSVSGESRCGNASKADSKKRVRETTQSNKTMVEVNTYVFTFQNYYLDKKNGKKPVIEKRDGLSEEQRVRRSKGTKIREPNNTGHNRRFDGPRIEDHNKNSKEKIKRQVKKHKVDLSSIDFPTELPEEIKHVVAEMNGTDLTLVANKALTWTDLSRNHNRLSIPENSAAKCFLTPGEEKTLVEQKENDPKAKGEIPVILIDPSGKKFDKLNLRKWEMNTNVYVLVTKWNNVVAANNFNEGDVIQLWTFRSGTTRCFAIVVVKKENEAKNREAKNCEAKKCEAKNDKETGDETEKVRVEDHGGSTSGSKTEDGESKSREDDAQ